MDEQYSRTAMLIGEDGLDKLRNARVAVFGVGGVGGYAIEALARCGIGTLDLFDDDTVSVSNLNRQIIALKSTVGMAKVDAAAARIADIDNSIRVNARRMFFVPETADQVDFSLYDAVIDAIDTVSGKLEIITRAQQAGAYVISAMGAGNKLDPTKLTACDIYETSVCPLARVMRRELKKRGVKALRVVYSTEEARTPIQIETAHTDSSESPLRTGKPKTNAPGSISFVPSAAGLIIASETVKYILDKYQRVAEPSSLKR
ncbi:MAG: ThiF family adenylyltransferase [Huintestinicola sp.]